MGSFGHVIYGEFACVDFCSESLIMIIIQQSQRLRSSHTQSIDSSMHVSPLPETSQPIPETYQAHHPSTATATQSRGEGNQSLWLARRPRDVLSESSASTRSGTPITPTPTSRRTEFFLNPSSAPLYTTSGVTAQSARTTAAAGEPALDMRSRYANFREMTSVSS